MGFLQQKAEITKKLYKNSLNFVLIMNIICKNIYHHLKMNNNLNKIKYLLI